MDFKLSEPTKNYNLFRLVDVTNQWEVGAYFTLFGCRISANRIGSNCRCKGGICCGLDSLCIIRVLTVTLAILNAMEPSSTNKNLEDRIPSCEMKPVCKSLKCMTALANAAEQSGAFNFRRQYPEIYAELMPKISDVNAHHSIHINECGLSNLLEDIHSLRSNYA